MDRAIEVFISYAAKDAGLRDELEAHLAPLKSTGRIRAWHAGMTGGGEEPRRVINERLGAARVVVLLVSSDYLAGNGWEQEMEPALARARAGTAVVIPVLARPCGWSLTPFAGLAPLPTDRKAVTIWSNQDAAWANVAEGIRAVVEKLAGQPAAAATRRTQPPLPRFEHPRVQRLAADLEGALERRKALLQHGAGTSDVDQEILDLRRKLREGGRLRAGDVLGDRYRLLAQIGRGGFATVWSAFDRERQESVAVKVLHPELAKDPVRFDRFFRGARVMARMGHEAVVRVHCEQGDDGGWLYFVMELLAGDLEHAMMARRVTSKDAVPLVLRVGEAVAEAHARGIVHRDIKPANVLLDDAGAPRLTDFDLVAAGDTTGGTRTGALGSWLYAAPEQMHDAKTADVRADVYGLGMTLLFCLHGGNLPPIVARKPEVVIAALGCREEVKRVVGKAIELEPADRYADASAFCVALREAAKQHAIEEIQEDQFGKLMSFRVGDVVQRMRWVPAGTFLMGSPAGEAGRRLHEGPQHEVTISEGYWLGETPVTQALWKAVMGENPSRFAGPDRPVETVSWEDCQRFLERLEDLVPGLGARLPTEAEWERACRGGTTGATWVGELDVREGGTAPELDPIAWYSGNSGGETHPVARKQPNPFGLHDMLGNVWDWCADIWGPYGATAVVDPRGPATGSDRVLRGGAWLSLAGHVRAADRPARDPAIRYGDLGFRLARSQPGPPQGTEPPPRPDPPPRDRA